MLLSTKTSHLIFILHLPALCSWVTSVHQMALYLHPDLLCAEKNWSSSLMIIIGYSENLVKLNQSTQIHWEDLSTYEDMAVFLISSTYFIWILFPGDATNSPGFSSHQVYLQLISSAQQAEQLRSTVHTELLNTTRSSGTNNQKDDWSSWDMSTSLELIQRMDRM